MIQIKAPKSGFSLYWLAWLITLGELSWDSIVQFACLLSVW